MKVLVLCGGASSERVVSMASGDAVAKWVAALGHDVVKYDPERAGELFNSDETIAPPAIGLDAPALKSASGFEPCVVRGLLDVLERERVELVFPILHGGYGENGTLQSFLEWVGMPYTGSGPLSCAAAMHKPTAKTLMYSAGVPLARGFEVSENELGNVDEIKQRISREFGYPAIVKPQNGGSTVGLTVLQSEANLSQALDSIREQHDGALIEQLFSGREIAATVIDGVAFPLIEIRPKQGIYDYANKYTSGRTEYICPAVLPTAMTVAIQQNAVRVFHALGARGFARIDFLANDKEFICLELNSLPGMTATSLVPKAAKAYGWTAEQLIAKIIETSWSPSEMIAA